MSSDFVFIDAINAKDLPMMEGCVLIRALGYSLINLAEPIKLYKMAKNKVEEEELVYELIERAGLSKDQLEKYPHEISGGQVQRLSIVRALSLNPKLLICDEPTSMLYISHDLEIIRAICNRMAVMRQGKIIEMGSVEEVFENPQHEYIKYLLASKLDA
ncbi:MAG: ABC transporter ATP-binding protein [Desulfosporosinus sp.]|nr:ABC transporter ATP-binding protein [Desulfosporosinus sp.]